MKLKRLLLLTLFVPFLFHVTTTHAQEKEADFQDGTVLYYTMLDTNVNQLHRIHAYLGTELSVEYMMPQKNLRAAAIYDYADGLLGAEGNYFFASNSKEKKLKANAKFESTGYNSGIIYAIHMATERRIMYGVHGGVYLLNPNPVFNVNNTPKASKVPEIAIGLSRFNIWGIKYLIRDPKNSARSMNTIICQRIGSLNADLLIFPVKPTSSDSTLKYTSIGWRIYFKGCYPMFTHRDIGVYALGGIQSYAVNNGIHLMAGVGLHVGWQ